MMWRTSGGLPTTVRPPSDFQLLRGRQIASLQRACPNAQPLTPDQSIFDIPFQIAQGNVGHLRVSLSNRFPQEPPVVQTVGKEYRHGWIDRDGIITGHPGLRAWSAHSDLGRIVSEVIVEFQKNPPSVLVLSGQSSQQGQSSYGNNSAYPQQSFQQQQSQNRLSYSASPPATMGMSPYNTGVGQVSSMPSPTLSQTSSTSGTMGQSGTASPAIESRTNAEARVKAKKERLMTSIPPIPTSFPEINGLSKTELEHLINNEEERRLFVEEMTSVKVFRSMKEEILKSSAELAKKNLEYEDKIETLQNQIDILRVELQSAMERFTEKAQRQRDISMRFQPANVIEKLEIATGEIEQASDDLASKFTDGDMPFAEFQREYLKLRKVYHLRKAKLDCYRGA